MDFWSILIGYLIFDVAFLLTSYITLHIPSWRIVMAWARENVDTIQKPSKWYVISHTIAYSILALLVFPLLMLVLITNNQVAIEGYTKAIIKGIIDE